jgi:hypothetical protein
MLSALDNTNQHISFFTLPKVRDGHARLPANPRGKIPGNKMVFAGIKNETEIANLWTYLSHFNVDGSSK